ncbi:hypothetical protein QVD17_34012 [Tagetes erecta]|uniref:F-box/kelch-repeat protein SKIP25 n=1 Tax=Tagetes erecta TaxID=13708 RepID=A0AAD8JZ69_TARER|nr:hypothetical protein QVD17_34012 [Tagetes erecta]
MANQTLIPRATKRRRISGDHHHHSLLPGLPDHIAQLCLSLTSPSALYSVCRSWRRLIYSGDFPPFRSLYTLSLPTTTAGESTGGILRLSSFDPISGKWITFDSPAPPLPPHLHHRYHPIQSVSVSGNLVLIAATSVHRNLPVPAFSCPLIFNPLSNTWSLCPPLSTPRRWCAAGALQDTVVIASGIGSHYSETVARSVEKWVCRKIESCDEKRRDLFKSWGNNQSLNNSMIKIESFDEKKHGNCENNQSFNDSTIKPKSLDEKQHGNLDKIQSSSISTIKKQSLDEKPHGNWEKIQSLNNLTINESFDEKHEKIQSFNTWTIKNESVDETQHGNWKKIQSLDSKRHDSIRNWEKMRSLKHSKLCREAIDAVGWKGKLCMVNVKGDYAKEGFVYNLDSDEWSEMPVGMLVGWKGPAAAMGEETMYVVDESRGVLRRYNEDGDSWSEIVVDERLKGAEYIAAGGGRVCVVGEKEVGIVVVDVVATPPRLWVVETPAGDEILAVHILPRMCSPEFGSSVSVSGSKL